MTTSKTRSSLVEEFNNSVTDNDTNTVVAVHIMDNIAKDAKPSGKLLRIHANVVNVRFACHVPGTSSQCGETMKICKHDLDRDGSTKYFMAQSFQ